MKKDDLEDLITLIGELEHARRHLRIRALKAETDDEAKRILAEAQALRTARREIMLAAGVGKKNWCLIKSLAICRQLVLEIEWDFDNGNLENDLRYIDSLISKYLDGEDPEYCAECDKEDE